MAAKTILMLRGDDVEDDQFPEVLGSGIQP